MKKLFKLFTLCICSLLCSYTNAQNISTIAGSAVAGYSGDGNSATSAKLNAPNSVAIDATGNLYIADYYNHVIRKVNTSGIISTFAGNTIPGYAGDGSSATSAKLNYPYGVATDAAGNVYIADKNNNVIRKVNTSGIISTYAGNSTPGYSGDGGLATSAALHFPAGIATDPSGNIYISDSYNHVIRKINTSGIISTIAGNQALGLGYSGDGGAATSARLNYPWGIAVDAAGAVYIADEHNNVIRKVNTSGIISTFAGNAMAGYSGDGNLATAAQLNTPDGVAVDASGEVYISDINNNVIRKVNFSGIISTFAGNSIAGYSGDGGPAINAQLFEPSGLCLDVYGNVYVADNGNYAIRKIASRETAVKQFASNTQEINIYPNPTTGKINLEPDQGDKLKINDLTIYNSLGEKIYQLPKSEINSSLNYQIDLFNQPGGIYYLNLVMDGVTISKKVTLQK